jgi:hypothetical protein
MQAGTTPQFPVVLAEDDGDNDGALFVLSLMDQSQYVLAGAIGLERQSGQPFSELAAEEGGLFSLSCRSSVGLLA